MPYPAGGCLGVKQVIRTSAPTVNDDSYGLLSQWLNETTNTAYALVEVAPGAAVWAPVT